MSRLLKLSLLILIAFTIELSAQMNVSSEKTLESGNGEIVQIVGKEDIENSKNILGIRQRVLNNRPLNNSISSSVNALSRYAPGAVATGLLGYFKLAPDLTNNKMSFGYFSDGNSSGYVASYTYNLGYNIGKYGLLNVDLTASKVGSSKYEEYLQFQPNVNWQYTNENFNVFLNVNGPPIIKKQSDNR